MKKEQDSRDESSKLKDMKVTNMFKNKNISLVKNF